MLGLDSFYNNTYEQAENYFKLALDLAPDRLSVLTNLSATLIKLDKLYEAKAITSKTLELYPFDVSSLLNHGILLEKLADLQSALLAYEKAITISPQYAEAYNNRGSLLKELKDLNIALSNLNYAIALKDNLYEAYTNRGIILRELKLLEEALESHDKAIEIKSDYAEAYSNRGHVLDDLNELNEALISFNKAIEFKTNFAEAYLNRGAILKKLRRLDEALLSYDQAIGFKQNLSEAHLDRGNVLRELMRLDEALISFEQAINIDPNISFGYGLLLSTKMQLCEWANFDSNLNNLIYRINRFEKVCPSFISLALTDSPSIQRKASEIWGKTNHPFAGSIGPIQKYLRKDKIRIAYYSPDFRIHPVAQWVAELFELHDKTKFELIGFYFGPITSDKYHNRISTAFDQFIEASDMSDFDIANLSRKMEIDIAIDLAGFTSNSRTGIFAYRAAPIQVNYIGYPATMGVEYMDYMIADKLLIPENSQQYYSEKIVYLPFSFKPTDTKLKISNKMFSKAEFSLPENSFVFCCFNNSYKILPTTFDSWMRILKKVEHSVLWLAEVNTTAKSNLLKETRIRGVNPDRIIFCSRMDDLSDHLARIKLADLFLDTFTYNAHTTAGDALWAGLPLLTCMGKSFASRVAASFLNAIELPELITHTHTEYEALAIDLATDPAKLRLIKDKLQLNIKTTPLFDMLRFTKNIESAYRLIYERSQDDLLPDHLHVRDESYTLASTINL